MTTSNTAASSVPLSGSVSSEVARSSRRPAPPRLALTAEEAAQALGMSRDSFDRHVKNEVPMVRRGRLRLFGVGELQRWVERSAERTLETRSLR